MQKTLKRQTFTVSRELEYFSEAELTTQTGYARELWWPEVVAKELVDNALDGSEQGGTAPAIVIDLERHRLEVRDNGPGIQPAVVKRILDYSTRTGDKQAYVSPTRGAQGNALKTILAIPYVLAGGREVMVEIESRGLKHRILVSTDAIARRPKIQHEAVEIVKSEGTLVRVPGDSTCSNGHEESLRNLQNLILDYSLFNPHATFTVNGWRFGATTPGWRKWLPTDPTCAHWYDVERFEYLVASYVAAERDRDKKPRTVREFVSEFRGLSSTAKQSKVTDRSRLGRAYLHELVSNGKLDRGTLARLLEVMKKESQPVRPEGLGVLGEDHFRRRIAADPKASGETFRYSRQKGFDARGLPYLVECAFAMVDGKSPLRGLHTGLNWSVPLGQALQQSEFNVDDENVVAGLTALLAGNRIDIERDPVCLAVHLACPRFNFLDRGKGSVSL
jgi:DNA topoisomerase VI subunit B